MKMSVRKKLQNPFALVAQGFVLGGLLFFATHSERLQARADQSPAQASALAR
jgi:hypothetical protein